MDTHYTVSCTYTDQIVDEIGHLQIQNMPATVTIQETSVTIIAISTLWRQSYYYSSQWTQLCNVSETINLPTSAYHA